METGFTDWITKHGGAVVTLAGAAGAFVGAMGVEPPVIEDALTGIGAAVGLVGAVIHAYLVGASGGTE